MVKNAFASPSLRLVRISEGFFEEGVQLGIKPPIKMRIKTKCNGRTIIGGEVTKRKMPDMIRAFFLEFILLKAN